MRGRVRVQNRVLWVEVIVLGGKEEKEEEKEKKVVWKMNSGSRSMQPNK